MHVGSEKRTLTQFISGERGGSKERPRIDLTAEAQANLDALPEKFLDWHERHTTEVKLAA